LTTSTGSTGSLGPIPGTSKPIEKVDGSWDYKPRRFADLAAVVKAGELLYVDASPFGSHWDSRKGEAPRFADFQAALATRGLRAVYETSFYWRITPTEKRP